MSCIGHKQNTYSHGALFRIFHSRTLHNWKNGIHEKALKTQGQISKKRRVGKNYSCDKARQFPALWGISCLDYLEKLSIDNKYINKPVRRFIHYARCVFKLRCYEEKNWEERLFMNLRIGISVSASALASALPSALQKKNFFKKNGTLLCLVVRYQHTLLQIFISLRFPIHPSRGVYWCSRKKTFEILEALVH